MVRDMHPRAWVSRAVLGAVLVLVVAGCGSGGTKDDEPSKAAVACRDQWKDLGKQVRGNDEKSNPSALAPRWNSVVATIEYYASSAKASGCDKAIDRQKEAISSLTKFGTKLAPYDMGCGWSRCATTPRPTRPRPARRQPPPAPRRRTRRSRRNRKAEADPGARTFHHQRRGEDLDQPGAGGHHTARPRLAAGAGRGASDPAAVAKAVKDLAFLSTESAAWRACQGSSAQIKVALAAAAK